MDIRELAALAGVSNGANDPGVSLAGLGAASARLSQPGAACPNCSGAGAQAPAEAASAPAANLGGLLDWLGGGGAAPAAGGPQGAAPAGGPQAAPPGGAEGNWGPEDEQMLDKAISETSGGAGGADSIFGATKEEFNHLFEEFGQSQEGNCAAVAVIKAAMDKYKGKVFQGVQKAGDGYDVTLQDGAKVQVSREDLKKAAGAAKFKSNKPSAAKSMAVLMYAVIAKQAAKDGQGSFEQALQNLGKGQDPRKVAKWLGLGNKIKEVNPNQLQGQEAAVAWNDKHAVYVDDGTKADSYGQAKPADGTDTRGGRLTNAFVFVD
ncbi:MAG: hypothetical protein AB1758_05095 [Candidatus Eremiobacterota bacterium]